MSSSKVLSDSVKVPIETVHEHLGEKVTTWQTGQIVAALPIVGGYSEYILLSSNEKQ